MVDVTDKPVSARQATASSSIRMTSAAAATIRSGGGRKGDVLAVARIAAIAGAKWTSTLIPLCHAIPIEGVEIEFRWIEPDQADSGYETLQCRASVKTTCKTGVEMEAMTAASIAGLTVYDMLKSVDRAMEIRSTRLEAKRGGKSGDFFRE